MFVALAYHIYEILFSDSSVPGCDSRLGTNTLLIKHFLFARICILQVLCSRSLKDCGNRSDLNEFAAAFNFSRNSPQNHGDHKVTQRTTSPLWNSVPSVALGEFEHSAMWMLEFILRLLSQSFELSRIQKFHQGLARVRSRMDLALWN